AETRGLAANSAAHVALRVPTASDAKPTLSPDLAPAYGSFVRAFDVDPTDPKVMADLGAEGQRPILLSLGIVDPADFKKLLAAPEATVQRVPFSVRFSLVIPIADLAKAAAALDRAASGPECGHPGGDAARWTAW